MKKPGCLSESITVKHKYTNTHANTPNNEGQESKKSWSVYLLAGPRTRSLGWNQNIWQNNRQIFSSCLDTLMFYLFTAHTHTHTQLFWWFTGKTLDWCCEKYLTANKHVFHRWKMACVLPWWQIAFVITLWERCGNIILISFPEYVSQKQPHRHSHPISIWLSMRVCLQPLTPELCPVLVCCDDVNFIAICAQTPTFFSSLVPRECRTAMKSRKIPWWSLKDLSHAKWWTDVETTADWFDRRGCWGFAVAFANIKQNELCHKVEIQARPASVEGQFNVYSKHPSGSFF